MAAKTAKDFHNPERLTGFDRDASVEHPTWTRRFFDDSYQRTWLKAVRLSGCRVVAVVALVAESGENAPRVALQRNRLQLPLRQQIVQDALRIRQRHKTALTTTRTKQIRHVCHLSKSSIAHRNAVWDSTGAPTAAICSASLTDAYSATSAAN
jgi:hypothetical protein